MLVCVGTGPIQSQLTVLVTHVKTPSFLRNKTYVMKGMFTE